MKEVKITLCCSIEDDFRDELASIIDHNIEYLLDLDGNPEIHSVYNAEMEDLPS